MSSISCALAGIAMTIRFARYFLRRSYPWGSKSRKICTPGLMLSSPPHGPRTRQNDSADTEPR